MIAEMPTLYVCHGDDGGPQRHPCRRVQEALRAAGIEYEKVIAAHGHPIPFLRRGSRDELREVTGDTKLPALKCPTARSSGIRARSWPGYRGRVDFGAADRRARASETEETEKHHGHAHDPLALGAPTATPPASPRRPRAPEVQERYITAREVAERVGLSAGTIVRYHIEGLLRMGTSVKMIDRTYGHLVAGADAYERELLDAFDAAPKPLGRYLDAEGEQNAA